MDNKGLDLGCIVRFLAIAALAIGLPWLGLRWYFAPEEQTFSYVTDAPPSEWRDFGGYTCPEPYHMVYKGTRKVVAWSCDGETWQPHATGDEIGTN
jgi:hypothetical protein